MEMSYAKPHQQRCKLTKGDLRKCPKATACWAELPALENMQARNGRIDIASGCDPGTFLIVCANEIHLAFDSGSYIAIGDGNVDYLLVISPQ
jgi:hypothetical protein